MKYLPVLVLAASSLVWNAHASAQTSQISAEFTKKIDTKDAKIGDQIEARTTAKAILADDTTLPKGTRLTGAVTDVHPKSSDGRNAHLAFSLDRAILPDGRQIPIHATLTSLSAPAPLDSSDLYAGSAPVSTGQSSGSTRGSGSGTTRATTGVASSTGRAAGNATSALGADTAGALPSDRPTAQVQGSSATGNYVSDALRLNHYPVGNMPGVILSSQTSATYSGALDANGRNITLETGTQMTMNASVIAR